MSNLIPAAPAIEGIPASPLVYLVVTGEYDDYRVRLACADQGEAERQADKHNREHRPGLEGDAARVEPVEFVPARRAVKVTQDPATAKLNRIYAAVDHLTNLDGQDRSMVIEMSQAMLNDLIEGRDLAPMVDYVRRFCDVLDSPEDLEQIAADI